MSKWKVNGIDFKYQKDLMSHVRSVLIDNENMTISTMDDDYQFLYELIQRHPRYDDKVYGHIEAFRVIKNFGGHLALNYIDEQGEKDISFIKCVKMNSKTNKAELLEAMREAVKDQTIEYKAINCDDSSRCGLCERPLTYKGAQVDHKTKSFKLLSDTFIDGNINIPSRFISTGPHLPNGFDSCGTRFKAEWKRYHRINADYQLLCQPCNIKKK